MSTEIKNIGKAAERITKAVKNKENIVIYGDADLDGVTSVIILQEAIKNLGGKISAIYFPNREVEGYGITETGLNFLKDKAPALFVAVDCGIGNFKEIAKAGKMGFETIIVDHHEVLDKLPNAKIIVDPKQKKDFYPFKGFAAVGIVFKLSEVLLKNQFPEILRKNFLELVALATIADMMPQIHENKMMIEDGLSYIKSSWRPGIQVLFNLKQIKSLDLIHKVYKIISLLNVRDVENGLPAAFRVLTALEKKEAEKLAARLYKKGILRKEKTEKMIDEIEKRISKKEAGSVIFEGDSDWEEAFLGISESIISQKYDKPVFLYKKLEKESQGGIRAPSGFNVVEAMKTCSKYLLTYGGHPQAAGFRVKNENLNKFKECIIKYFAGKKR